MHSFAKHLSHKISKLSQSQIESLINELILENENFYSILESLNMGLIIVDNNFHLEQSNTIAESRIHFSHKLDEGKIYQKPIWELILDEEISDFLKNCANKQITNSSEDFSTTTSGGSVRFLNITLTPFVKNNQVLGRTILIRDITDQKNQEILFHRMENLANLTNLAAGMAHDIKNPLGAISIHIQLLQKAIEKGRKNENQIPDQRFVEEKINIVNEEIEHLNNLVMDFLFAVRPLNANLELLNPGKLIENIADFITPEFNKANIKVEINCNSTKKIMLDEKLFRQIIMNFSQNALYAIKAKICNMENEASGTSSNFTGLFKIDCLESENKYIICISDNGCGMNEKTVEKIFEPYFTTKSNGTGLGMTMVYKIVKEFSGEIQVQSEENLGSIFKITLPIPQDNKILLKV